MQHIRFAVPRRCVDFLVDKTGRRKIEAALFGVNIEQSRLEHVLFEIIRRLAIEYGYIELISERWPWRSPLELVRESSVPASKQRH